MIWQSVLKFTPELQRLASDNDKTIIQLGNETQMKEMWDASNPDMPHSMRSENKWLYPIDNWYGVIVDEDGKKRLVSVVGNSIQTGKDGKQFAFFGGAKTHPDYAGKGLMRGAREKALSSIEGIPRIAGFTTQRKKKGVELKKPTTHEIIPDEILEFMSERINHLENVDDWGISKKWFDEEKKAQLHSHKQTYWLEKNKPDVSRRMGGVLAGWHTYKRLRDSGLTDEEALANQEYLDAREKDLVNRYLAQFHLHPATEIPPEHEDKFRWFKRKYSKIYKSQKKSNWFNILLKKDWLNELTSQFDWDKIIEIGVSQNEAEIVITQKLNPKWVEHYKDRFKIKFLNYNRSPLKPRYKYSIRREDNE